MIRLLRVPHFIKKLIPRRGEAIVLLGTLLTVFPSSALAFYIQIDGVADIKSNFSEGCSSITDIANQAERQKIDVVLFGDFARNSIEFGIKPFEKIFKKITHGPSVLDRGMAGYLSEIRDNDRQFEHTLLIHGVETIPFYFWTGSNYDRNLTAHNWDKHLLVFGMDSAEGYEQLPLPNSNFSKKYTHELLNNFMVIGLIFMVLVGTVYKGHFRKITVPLMLLFAMLTLNNHPFQSSPFNPHKGDQGVAPYQNLIDFATSRGALVFWSHMETASRISEKGPFALKTLPYPNDLLTTQNYTGFQAVGNVPIGQTDPGQQWDQVLMEYLNGNREQPVWGFGNNDFLCENQNGDSLGSVRTIFLVRERNNNAVLNAMKKGRMYAVRQADTNRLSLDEFIVEDQKVGNQATMGEELVATDFPAINLKLRSVHGGNKTTRIMIIRNGVPVKEETVSLPSELTWKDIGIDRKEPVYYRVMATVSPQDHLVSNPVFVKFAENIGVDVASAPTLTPPGFSVPTPDELQDPKEPVAVPQPGMAELAPQEPPSPPAKLLTVMFDGVEMKKGPGEIFPNITKLRKGQEVSFVRRTNIELNHRNWLVVKHMNRPGYIWEGALKWSAEHRANN